MALRTHCKRGHLLSWDNVYCKPSYKKSRGCLTCIKQRGVERTKKRQLAFEQPTWTRPLPCPSESDLCWAAGLFEGEGTVTLSAIKGSKYPWLTVAKAIVGNTDEEVVSFFEIRWGGKVRPRKPSSPKAKPSFEWSLCGQAAVSFFEDLLPFIQTRRVRNKIAVVVDVEHQRLQRMGRAHNDEIRTLMREALVKIRELNRRGVSPTP